MSEVRLPSISSFPTLPSSAAPSSTVSAESEIVRAFAAFIQNFISPVIVNGTKARGHIYTATDVCSMFAICPPSTSAALLPPISGPPQHFGGLQVASAPRTTATKTKSTPSSGGGGAKRSARHQVEDAHIESKRGTKKCAYMIRNKTNERFCDKTVNEDIGRGLFCTQCAKKGGPIEYLAKLAGGVTPAANPYMPKRAARAPLTTIGNGRVEYAKDSSGKQLDQYWKVDGCFICNRNDENISYYVRSDGTATAVNDFTDAIFDEVRTRNLDDYLPEVIRPRYSAFRAARGEQASGAGAPMMSLPGMLAHPPLSMPSLPSVSSLPSIPSMSTYSSPPTGMSSPPTGMSSLPGLPTGMSSIPSLDLPAIPSMGGSLPPIGATLPSVSSALPSLPSVSSLPSLPPVTSLPPMGDLPTDFVADHSTA